MSKPLHSHSAPLPGNERTRLQILEKYNLWNTAPDDRLDHLTKLAAAHFNVPTALISLVGETKQWFKSRVGLAACETPRDVSFCAHAILSNELLIVPDARLDDRFKNNALVTGPPWIRFYAGAPLEVEADVRLGSFCIIDDQPRPQGLTESEQDNLKSLGSLAISLFESYLDRSVFETSPAAVYVVDSETLQILNGNTAAAKLFGYTRRDLHDLELKNLLGEQAATNLLQKLLAPGESGPWEFTKKDGSHVLALITSRQIRFLGRSALLSILTDVTEITETQLRLSIALEAADVANQAKAQFLATMSHELRTPLTHILGMAEVLLHTDLSAEQRECAEVICSSGKLLTSMVSGILHYSKEGSRVPEIVEFSPQSLIASAVKKWSEACIDKGLDLTALVDGDVPTEVIGDLAGITQILDHLINNAVKFTKSGFVKIEADTSQEPGRLPELRFFVSDSGVGISPGLACNIFKPFSQEDGSDTRRYGGAGMGLAICQRIVDHLSGSITFSSSKSGTGTRFCFSVPVQLDPAVEL